MRTWILSYPKPVGRRDGLSVWRWRFGSGSVTSRDLIILSFPFIGYHASFKMAFGRTGDEALVWIYAFQPVRLGSQAGMSWRNTSCLHADCVPVPSFSGVGLFVIPWAVSPCRLLCPWDSQQDYWSGLPIPPPGWLHESPPGATELEAHNIWAPISLL